MPVPVKIVYRADSGASWEPSGSVLFWREVLQQAWLHHNDKIAKFALESITLLLRDSTNEEGVQCSGVPKVAEAGKARQNRV